MAATGTRGSDWERVDALRTSLYAPAVGLIVTGIVAAWAGWGFVTAALAIALGSVLLDNHSSKQRLHDKLSGRVGCCGRPEDGAVGRSRGGCCCGVIHVFPLAVATCVFACIDIVWAFPVSITQHNFYFRYESFLCSPTYSPRYNYYCDDSFKQGQRYIGTMLITTWVWSVIILALTAFVISVHGRLLSLATHLQAMNLPPPSLQPQPQLQATQVVYAIPAGGGGYPPPAAYVQQAMPPYIAGPGGGYALGQGGYPVPYATPLGYAPQQQQQQQQQQPLQQQPLPAVAVAPQYREAPPQYPQLPQQLPQYGGGGAAPQHAQQAAMAQQGVAVAVPRAVPKQV